LAGAGVSGAAGAAFVPGAGGVFVFWLQPVSMAPMTSPNNTTRVDILFMVSIKFTQSAKSTSGISFGRSGGHPPRLLNQLEILAQVGETELLQAALLLAKQFARTSQLQVRFGDEETIGRFLEHL